MTEPPHPGTEDAHAKGCTCPIIDNHYGKGRGGDGERYGWYMMGNCPLHSPAAEPGDPG